MAIKIKRFRVNIEEINPGFVEVIVPFDTSKDIDSDVNSKLIDSAACLMANNGYAMYCGSPDYRIGNEGYGFADCIEEQPLIEDKGDNPLMDINTGSYVLALDNNIYAYRVGRVIDVHRKGSPAHDTDNPGDDYIVDFSDAAPFHQRAGTVRSAFLPFVDRELDGSGLDYVVMAKDMLLQL